MAMEIMLQHTSCQNFRTYCKNLIAMIKEPQVWPSFATELEAIKTLKICFPDFIISHILMVQNLISDSLAKIARSFHREFCYIGCFIPVWYSGLVIQTTLNLSNRIAVRCKKKHI
ncbi:hypothetical protein IGI04_030128 [Brassica rapa subsp. trilocularis]|uniref:Uncharacterized protein n=1 Tax=Brassica rapa subsp. trilocularis TaxID=1813537 RepID=A0ABQ7LQN4_BRACM|nr:hypothetical protein IGI04_030128 [Brassica rapa subsp. trilocularis]